MALVTLVMIPPGELALAMLVTLLVTFCTWLSNAPPWLLIFCNMFAAAVMSALAFRLMLFMDGKSNKGVGTLVLPMILVMATSNVARFTVLL